MKPNKINFPINNRFNCVNASNQKIDDNYEMINEWFVSKSMQSGGRSDISPSQLAENIEQIKNESYSDKELFWAITDEGQFQLYVGLFVKIKQ